MKNKSITWIALLFCLVVMLISCGGGDSPASPSHIHSFNEITLQCSCGLIDEGIIAYIGNSYSNATARFKSLQAAVDYLFIKQNSKSISSENTIHGYGSSISCNGLTIDNVEVAFDFSNTIS